MSEYKEIIDNMRWSYSRLSSFEQCKYEFYLNYIVNDDDQYLSEDNFYAEVGSYVHEILAKIFNGELPLDDATKYYIDNFDNNVFHYVKKSIVENTFESCADYFSEVDFEWLRDYEILGVEKEVNLQVEGYSFIGYIDLLLRDKRDGKIVVMDHKSARYPLKANGEVKKDSQESFNSYKKQMYLYSYAVKQLYGEYPKEICWNHFKEGGKFVRLQFCESECDETLVWMIDTIHKIENEEAYEPTLNFFYCKNLCSFRTSCEYCDDEV